MSTLQRLLRPPLTLLRATALGITEEVEALGLRGTKKKKSKKLDEDFLVSDTENDRGCVD